MSSNYINETAMTLLHVLSFLLLSISTKYYNYSVTYLFYYC